MQQAFAPKRLRAFSMHDYCKAINAVTPFIITPPSPSPDHDHDQSSMF